MSTPTPGDHSATPQEASTPVSDRRYVPTRSQVLRVLTLTQNTSAMVFSIFLVPHLASPIAAVFGGLQVADKTMMIARDLYLPLEPFLVYAPLTIHILASLSRRLLILASCPTFTLSPLKLRLPRQIHQILGYPLIVLVSTHILTHRLIPSSSTAPISSMSPSEFGWEFVGYNLRKSWMAWGVYLTLIGSAVWHSLVGGMKIVTWLRGDRKTRVTENSQGPSRLEKGAQGEEKKKKEIEIGQVGEKQVVVSKRRKLGLRGLIVALLGVISIGLARVASDTGPISSITIKRYEAVYAHTPWAHWWR
ncbi:hypothetical protein IAR55_002490 [Kwoniella newhampshirensis]|uniref:Mitochondrial adapter protein MCP1 transmembrane domain-containing protein n=1 Tax=Kwoniella newhampshirensis TaxID=1651941 RepID=A0AAW0Z1L7_9TREE